MQTEKHPMKKSAIALAAAGVLGAGAAAHAETTLYGSARSSVIYVNPDASGRTSYWDVVNNASRLGLSGAEDLGGGLSAIYQYEFGVNLDGSASGDPLNQRQSWVGLKGGFGQASIGRQLAPIYNAIGAYTDFFNGVVEKVTFDRALPDQLDYGLIVNYDVIPRNSLRAGWGRKDFDAEGVEDEDTWVAGYEHRLSKRTKAWLEYGDTEVPGYLPGGNSGGALSIGMRTTSDARSVRPIQIYPQVALMLTPCFNGAGFARVLRPEPEPSSPQGFAENPRASQGSAAHGLRGSVRGHRLMAMTTDEIMR